MARAHALRVRTDSPTGNDRDASGSRTTGSGLVLLRGGRLRGPFARGRVEEEPGVRRLVCEEERPTMERLIDIFKEHHPREDTTDLIETYKFARDRHNGQLRADGTPHIVHAIEVAIELAERGYDKTEIQAALLHDVIEDCGVTLFELKEKFGLGVAYLVGLVTKPRLIEGRWVFADSVDFYTRPDEYQVGLFDRRATVHYGSIIESGCISAIMIKFFDSSGNIRDMANLPPWKRTRNADTIVKNILWLAPRVLSRQEYLEIVHDLELLGFEIPEKMLPRKVEGDVVVLPPRLVGFDLLASLAPPDSPDYVSLYHGGIGATYEIGLPTSIHSALSMDDVERITRGRVSEQPSIFPEAVGAHERILRVEGPTDDPTVIYDATRAVYLRFRDLEVV